MPYYTSEECSAHIKNLIETNKASLTPTNGDALRDVWQEEQNLIPKYPAVMVVSGVIDRDLVQTGMQAELLLNVVIYVMHSKLNKTKTRRTQEDIQMARKIVQLLHANKTLGGNVTAGIVFNETPGAMAGPQGQAVVGTRLMWRAQQREHLWQS